MYRTAMVVCTGFMMAALSAGTAWADGAVYAMTNALGNNQVLVYSRSSFGTLSSTPIQTISTQGGGSGLQLSAVDNLGSAGSVQLDPSDKFLYVVNTETAAANNGAGSYNSDCNLGSITTFSVGAGGMLTFVGKVSSGGLYPDSLAVRQTTTTTGQTPGTADLVYVLNAGGPGNCGSTMGPNVTGMVVNNQGLMTTLGSSQPIAPGPNSGGTGVNCALTGLGPQTTFGCGLNPPAFVRSPAQVRFTPDGAQVIVTVKGTNSIYAFPVQFDGTLGSPQVTQAPGPALPTYFGFTFDQNNHMLVTETFGAATAVPTGAAGAVSSFYVQTPGTLSQVSADVGDLGTAACWILLDKLSGKYAYVSNNLSNTISSYTVKADGTVTLLAAVAAPVRGPNDLAGAVENGVSFIYVVNAGNNTIEAFQINSDGSLGFLVPFDISTGFPAGSAPQGIAAY